MLEALPASHTAGLGHLLQDNYETAFEVPQAQFDAARLNTIETLLKLSIVDFAAHASTLESPDELSVYLARRLMREVSPSLIWITLHDMDVAHAGAFSLYIDAIQRTDRLCAEIWKAVEAEPEYKDKTNLFIMPDFGRDSDTDAGGNGFQHHRTGSPMARTTWMVAMGPGVHQGKVVDRPIESIDLAPTIATMFSCDAPFATGKHIQEFKT
jgi:arylsulfatase A-like enzyme